ncbi:ankyrin repeat domain-containing protein [Streptomyces sp. NPDC048297]|uniref:ankyrin repeat domain-containing protein n=1 Tax=Streptomyces sp. NPDC048297 TaxID=3365531 RepID=UPI003722F1A1
MTKKAPSAAGLALLDAADRGDVAAVRAALADGADPGTRDANGRTPLLRAALADRVEAAALLVAAGADVNAQDDREDSPWLVTGVTGSVAMMRALLPGGPDVTLTNRFGGVSVIPASERGHVAYVRAVLAETGIDVDHVNRLGWTALLEAVILGDGGRTHQEVVEVLLAAGADPLLPDADGVTAREHAERRGFQGIAAALRKAEE